MKLRNLFTGKKRNILLVSEGGSGKSSCVLDAFLFSRKITSGTE